MFIFLRIYYFFCIGTWDKWKFIEKKVDEEIGQIVFLKIMVLLFNINDILWIKNGYSALKFQLIYVCFYIDAHTISNHQIKNDRIYTVNSKK